MDIALIDDGVNPDCVPLLHIANHIYIVHDNKIEVITEFPNAISHGTICAAIISKTYPNIRIIDLKVLDEAGTASIEQLITALEWCFNNSIKLIHMSLGTLNFHESHKLIPVISALQCKGVQLVSAFHNSGFKSYPASVAGVFGVRCDIGAMLQEGEYTFDSCMETNTEHNLVVRTYNKLDNICGGISIPYTNSYAAPIITGYIAKFIEENNDATFKDILSHLQNSSLNKKYRTETHVASASGDSSLFVIQKPVIVFSDKCYNVLSTIHDFICKRGYLAEAFTDMDLSEGIIPIQNYLKDHEQISSSLLFILDEIYDPDIMLFALKRNHYNIPVDFTIIDAFIDIACKGYQMIVESFTATYETPQALFDGILMYFNDTNFYEDVLLT